ncbi:MAG: nickel-dependent lactate racemase, partial [bacterium]
IVQAVAGDLIEAHRAGCRILDSMYEKPIPARADIVIASQGGAPKDLNLYQVQKALDNAKHAVKPGGAILLVGACPEGLGHPLFAQWMTEAERPEDIVARLKAGFRLGGHKAAAIALVLEQAEIYLVSEMEPALVRSIFMKPAATLQEAYEAALASRPEATVLLMPYAGSTLPRVKSEQV